MSKKSKTVLFASALLALSIVLFWRNVAAPHILRDGLRHCTWNAESSHDLCKASATSPHNQSELAYAMSGGNFKNIASARLDQCEREFKDRTQICQNEYERLSSRWWW